MAVATSGQPHIDAAAAGVPTVASLARDWARRTPHHVAMREKDFGIWREYSWDTTWNLVLDAAHGLLALGVDTGDRVSIHSEDRPEWVLVDLAAVAIRGITVGLYPTNPAAEVEYLLTDSGASVHLAEDQEQVDKVLAMDGGPRTIIYLEPRGMHDYEDDRLLSWDEFLERGRAHRAEHPGEVERRMDQAQADDVMTLVYTSGTTGPPKGAMLTNANAAFSMDVIVNLGRAAARRQACRTRTTSSSPTCRSATSPSGSSRRGTWCAAGPCSTSPSRSTRSRSTSTRSSRRCSSPCRGSGRSSTPRS